jgi:hypothetical protein
MKVYAMDVCKGRTSRTLFQRGTASRRSIGTHPFICVWPNAIILPLMGMYTMYHSLMIILIKDLDIFEVFNKIKEFKALIKNLSERKIKILRSDNGGEYTSKEFVSFCRDVEIKRELTTPYNPQQNGVVERKNRTMLERSRSSYVLMGRSSYGSCLCAEKTIP